MTSLAALRKQVFDRDNHRCQVPGCTNGIGDDSLLRMHHIVRKADGGSDELDNLITHCAWHHAIDHSAGKCKGFSIKVTLDNAVANYLKTHPLETCSKITNALWMCYLENPSIIQNIPKEVFIKNNIIDTVSEYEADLAEYL